MVFRSSNLLAQHEAIAAGAGLGVLPVFLAAADPRLVPVLADDVDVRLRFWLVIPEGLRDVERVRVVANHLVGAIKAMEGVIPATPVQDSTTPHNCR